MNRFFLLVLILMIGTAPALSQNKDSGYSGKYIPKKYIADLKKPTMVMLTATWCGPCRIMKTEIMERPDVKSCLDSLNVLIIDIDDNDGKIYASKFTDAGYGHAIPYFALLDTKGNCIGHLGFADEEKFLSFLRKSLITDKNENEDENK